MTAVCFPFVFNSSTVCHPLARALLIWLYCPQKRRKGCRKKKKTERAGLQVKMDVLLQTAEESCLLGSDAWYGKLRDVVYALYEQKEIPLEMLIKAESRLGWLEMDVRLAEHGLTPLPQPAPEQPKQETVRDVADWLEASEKGGGETGMAQVREYILDFWKCAGE